MNRKKSRIFVIEDNLGDVLLIQEALNARAIEAELQVMSSGEEAQRTLSSMERNAAPDLIIIDLNLPRVSGMSILESVRARETFANTATMVLTSSKATQDRLQAEKLGADAFVSKPLTLDDFLNTVGSEVERLISSPARQTCRSSTRGESQALPLRSDRPAERLRSLRRSNGSARAASQEGS